MWVGLVLPSSPLACTYTCTCNKISLCSSADLKLWLLPLPLKGWASGLCPHTRIQCLSDTSAHIADQRHYLSIRSHSRGWGLGLRSIDWEGGVECNPFQMLLFKKQFVLSEEATKKKVLTPTVWTWEINNAFSLPEFSVNPLDSSSSPVHSPKVILYILLTVYWLPPKPQRQGYNCSHVLMEE